MRACVQKEYGDDFKSVLALDIAFPKPVLKQGEVLVKISYASCNPVDYKITQGNLKLGLKFSLPFVISRDFSATIEEIPESVATKLKVGDRVCGFLQPQLYKTGACAEYLAIKPNALAVVPEKVSMEDAAGMALVANTTFQALECVRLAKDSKVLVLGGSTATGMLALQMCRDYGCKEIVCTSSSEDLCKAHGATEVYNYRAPGAGKWEVDLASKQFDIVYDCVGGYDHWTGAVKVLKKSGGRYATIVGDTASKLDVGKLLQVGGAISNRKFWSMFGYPEYHMRIGLDISADRGLTYFLGLLSSGKAQSIVDVSKGTQTFDFTHEGAVAMWEKQKSGTCKGKLIMKIGQ